MESLCNNYRKDISHCLDLDKKDSVPDDLVFADMGQNIMNKERGIRELAAIAVDFGLVDRVCYSGLIPNTSE